jgi:hypothetical protein
VREKMKKALLLFLTTIAIPSFVASENKIGDGHVNDKLTLLYRVKNDIEKGLENTSQGYSSMCDIFESDINVILFFEQVYTAFSKEPYMNVLINQACDSIIDHRYSDIHILGDTASFFDDLIADKNEALIFVIMNKFKHIFDEYHLEYCKKNEHGVLINMTIQDCFFMTPNYSRVQYVMGLIVYSRILLPLVLEKIDAKIKKLEAGHTITRS